MTKEAKELPSEEMRERGEWGEHLELDLHRSTITLDDDVAETVKMARGNLFSLLDLITSAVPQEPEEEWGNWIYDQVKLAVYMRNIVRAAFLKSEGYEMPESWERIEGTLH